MEIAWFGHGTLRVFTFGQTLVFDPLRSNARLGTTFQPDSEPKASVVMLTGEKRDQVEPDTVARVLELRGTVIAPKGAMRPLVGAGRTDLNYAMAKAGEVYPIGEHIKIRCMASREGYDPGFVYVLESGETVVFLGDSLMDKSGWAYVAGTIKPNVVVYPPLLCIKRKEGGEAFKEWIAGLGNVSCIPILYHSSAHADPQTFLDQEDIPATLPPNARLEMLSSRPLVAKETKRMRRRN